MSQLKPQFAASGLGMGDRVLGHTAWFIFHFHLQFARRNHLAGEIKDFGEFVRRKAMIGVVARDPGLQKTRFDPPDRASTIDEVLYDMPHLSDVESRRDRVAVGQDQTDIQIGVLTKVCLEGAQVHAIIGIFLYRYMQAEIRYRPLVPSDYRSVVSLWQRCDGVEVAEGDDQASFSAYLERNSGLSFCAETNGVIIGAALCGHDGRRGFIYHLAVAPEFRGRGVGKEILQRGLAGLGEVGITRVLVLVAKNNSLGQDFWLSQGFEAISGALPLGKDLV